MADISQTTLSNSFSWMKMLEFWLKFHWSSFLRVQLTNIPAVVQIIAWRRSGDKPLSEPVMVSLMMHLCVTRPHWVNITDSNSKYIFYKKWKSQFRENLCTLLYPRFNEVERGAYWFHLVRLSICLSVRLWTESCPVCIFKNTRRIHFIFAHLIRQLQKVCHVYFRRCVTFKVCYKIKNI